MDTNTLLYQVPGGMLSNLISQLKQAGKEDKYYDVLAEIPRVRKDFGYPPLVTPTSQIVGTQAVMNVIVGKYKTFPKESKGLLRGEYGALPGEVNPEVRALAGIDPEAVITCRPADNIAPELETYKEQFKDIAKSEEDVLSLALFPQVAPKFLAWRDGPHEAPAQPAEAPKGPSRRPQRRPGAVRGVQILIFPHRPGPFKKVRDRFFRRSEMRRDGLFFIEKRSAPQLFFIRVHQRFL